MTKKTLLPLLFACAFLLGQSQANAQETKPQFTFKVEAGEFVEIFAECSGLGSQNEIIEHKILDPGGNEVIRKIPGKLKFYEITCKRPVNARDALWDWRKQVEVGHVDSARLNGRIILIDLKGIEIARWEFFRGWPASLKLSDKDFREELVLTVEGLERAH
jgi:phage tail-like protein